MEAIVFAADDAVSAAEIARHAAAPVEAVRAALARRSPPAMPRAASCWSSAAAAGCSRPRPTSAICCGRPATCRASCRGAAVETLAIVAYHEPVTRAEIEDIRGVQVSPGTLDTLLAAGWIRPAGRRESPGRPLEFATTPAFLVDFGLRDRRDLPGVADLKAAGLLDRVSGTGETSGADVHSER